MDRALDHVYHRHQVIIIINHPNHLIIIQSSTHYYLFIIIMVVFMTPCPRVEVADPFRSTPFQGLDLPLGS